jgi:hypothetical protein
VQSLKISLPDDVRTALDAASAQSGKSLADEIRSRLAWSFRQDLVDKPTRDLQTAVDRLAGLVELQFGHAWHAGADAFAAFTLGVAGAIGRHKLDENAAPPKSGRRVRLIASDEPATIGLGLEALAFNMPAADDPRVVAAIEKSTEEMRKLHKGGNND